MRETAGAKLERLMEIMRTLRGPNGCPWDREQTIASLRPFAETTHVAVGTAVNDARHDAPDCLDPAPPPDPTLF